MCDDTTEAENEVHLAKRTLTRREVTQLGVSAVALAVLPGCSGEAGPAVDSPAPTADPALGASAAPPLPKLQSRPTSSRRVSIETSDGKADGFFVSPSEGKHPGFLMWPDVAGLREAYETMATTLAARGYAVLVINQYYRSSPAPILGSFSEWRTEEGKAKLKPMIEAINAEGTARDGAAFVAWLDKQAEVDTGKKLGTCGYCMGGPFALRTAIATPDRVGLAASFHGGNLVTDKPDSPHLGLSVMKASLLIAIAQNDDERQPEVKGKLREAAELAKRPAEIEVYPAQHGFATIDSPVYDKGQAERGFSRMLALLETAL